MIVMCMLASSAMTVASAAQRLCVRLVVGLFAEEEHALKFMARSAVR